MTSTVPPFAMRLTAAAMLLFGGPVANVLVCAIVTPWLPGWTLAVLAPGFLGLGFAAWTAGAVAVTGGRLLARKPLQAAHEHVADPDNPGDALSFPPGSAVVPWALASAGVMFGGLLGIAFGNIGTTTAAVGALGLAWGWTLRAMIRRRWLSYDV